MDETSRHFWKHSFWHFLVFHFILSQSTMNFSTVKIKTCLNTCSCICFVVFWPQHIPKNIVKDALHGLELFKHLRPQVELQQFTPKAMMSYSIFSIVFFVQKYLQIRLYTLFLFTGMGVTAMHPGDNRFSPLTPVTHHTYGTMGNEVQCCIDFRCRFQ